MASLIVWIAALLLVYVTSLLFSKKKVRSMPPRVPGALPIFGHALKLSSSRDWILDVHKRYGDFFTLKLGGRDTVVVNDLEEIKRVMRAPEETLGFTALADMLTGYDEETKGYPSWKGELTIEYVKNNVLTRVSSAEQLIVGTTNALLNEIMKKEQKNEVVTDIGSLLKIIVASTTGKFLFQLDLPLDFYEECALLEKEQAKAWGLMIAISLRQKAIKKWAFSGYFKQREKCFKYLYPLVDLHRKGQGNSGFIKYFVEYERSPFSNLEIGDIICGFLLASINNTTNLATSTMVHLMKFPHYYKQIIAEVRSIPVENGEVVLRGNIPFLDAFIHEAARFGATVQGSIRLCMKDYDICSNDKVFIYTIPSGSLVMVSAVFRNFNPSIFSDPYEYNPERFLEPRKERKTEVSNWGGGVHLCPGKTFALEEARIITATILRNFDVTAKDVDKYGTILNGTTGAAMSPVSGNNYVAISRRTE